jgi:hypothetical protein
MSGVMFNACANESKVVCFAVLFHLQSLPCDIQYVEVLISLWLFLFPVFLFATQPKEFSLDGLKKLEQRSHKCVELRGEYVE